VIRTKYFDPDYRRDPKTLCWCHICQRDMKEGQPHRTIRYELDTMDAIHPDDWERAAVEIPARRSPHLASYVITEGRIGMDCARRLGLEWSK